MIRLIELLAEAKPNLKDYPDFVQVQYDKWERIKPGYGERYLASLPSPKEVWREVELGEKLMTVLKKINGQVTKVPPQQMPALHMKLLKQELPKLGKITDKQMLKLAWDPYARFKTVWDEVEYVLKIMLKNK